MFVFDRKPGKQSVTCALFELSAKPDNGTANPVRFPAFLLVQIHADVHPTFYLAGPGLPPAIYLAIYISGSPNT